MGAFKDLTNMKIGLWTVISCTEKRKGSSVVWVCRCDCGTIREVSGNNLNQTSRSCGCVGNAKLKKMATKHGESAIRTPEYMAWSSMKDRCYNIRCSEYHHYGGRGIKICRRWLHKEKGFANFLNDMGRRPSKLYSLDRFPDNDGNYTPKNCRWATKKEQSANTRANIWITLNGKKMLKKEFLKKIKGHHRDVTFFLKTKSPEEIVEIYKKRNLKRKINKK